MFNFSVNTCEIESIDSDLCIIRIELNGTSDHQRSKVMQVLSNLFGSKFSFIQFIVIEKEMLKSYSYTKAIIANFSFVKVEYKQQNHKYY
ncbi:MAG: hypothetical protein IPM14_18120 [bacterium]|nr:hypothetical protein [bacterium]